VTTEVNEADTPAPPPREVLTATRLRRWSEAALLLVGVLGLIGFAYPTLVFLDHLPQVDPRVIGVSVDSSRAAIDQQWIVQALISAPVLILVSGLPVGRLTGPGSLPGAVAQAIGGLAVAFWALAGTAFANIFFFGPDDHCRYASCWPLHEQIWAMVVPGVLTGIAMLVMACLVTRLAWWIRTLVPVVVWLGTVLVQHAVWTSYLLEIFQGPPR